MKVCHFGTLDNTQNGVTDELKGIPAEALQHCYEQWKQRLRRCIAAQGNYTVRQLYNETDFILAKIEV